MPIYRLLKESIIGKIGIQHTKRNLKKKIQVIELKSNENLEGILNINKLGDFDIKIYEPLSLRCKIGMIGPIEYKTNIEEVKEMLIMDGYKISRVERLKIGKKDDLKTTKTVKIWFETTTLPEVIEFMFEKFKVSPYYDKPWQCYKCQKFGHNANTCGNKEKCVLCSGNHRLLNCPNKDKENVAKCANCGLNHVSSYGGCPAMKYEKQIQKIRVQQNMSYREAALTANKEKQVKAIIYENRSNNARNNDAQAAQSQVRSKFTKESGTQTEDVNENRSTNENESQSFEKMANFLVEALNQALTSNNASKRMTIIAKLFESHFGRKFNITNKKSLSTLNASLQTPSSIPITTQRKNIAAIIQNRAKPT